jgi:hypothetical protein
MNTKIKKQNPLKAGSNSQLLIFNSKLFTSFRFPFGAVADPSTHGRSAVAERSDILSGVVAERSDILSGVVAERSRSVRHSAVIRNSSFVILSALLTACPEPTPPDYGLSLEAVDIVCTEATFKVSAGIDSTATWDCGLYRDDSLVISQSISGGSGYIRDTGLEPNENYSYHIGYLKEGKAKDRTQAVNITTLDTTSHDFTWTVETLGDYGSYLNDVAIVDENNIWVVGYITLGDSIYNAAHWDGNAWDMVHLPAVTYGGGLSMGWLTSIFAIDENNIWCFSSAGSYLKWDGNEWTSEWIPYRDGGIKAIWASSPEDVWFVGDKGSIVHYDGSGFTRIESGTEINLTNIEGTPDCKNIWICGYDNLTGSILLKGNLSGFHTINRITSETSFGQPGIISHIYEDIWIESNHYTYIAASGRIYQALFSTQGNADENIWWDYSNNSYPPRITTIDGTNPNNIFIAGHYSAIFHFSGKSWKYIETTEAEDNIWYAMDTIGNIVVVVGISGSIRGIVAIGK